MTAGIDLREVLRGQRALVTGASSGIGAAVARGYAAAGACVVVDYRGGHDQAEREVGEIAQPPSPCAGTRTLAQERPADVRQRLADLEVMLARLVDACGERGELGVCPIMEALGADGGPS